MRLTNTGLYMEVSASLDVVISYRDVATQGTQVVNKPTTGTSRLLIEAPQAGHSIEIDEIVFTNNGEDDVLVHLYYGTDITSGKSFGCLVEPDKSIAYVAGSGWNDGSNGGSSGALGYFATGTDAQYLTGTVASAQITGNYPNITGIGTITSGVWQGSPIDNSFLTNSSISIAGTTVSLGGTIAGTAMVFAAGHLSLAHDLTLAGPSNLQLNTATAGTTANVIMPNSGTLASTSLPQAWTQPQSFTETASFGYPASAIRWRILTPGGQATGNYDMQLRANCVPAPLGTITPDDAARAFWALSMGPYSDSFSIYRAPAGSTTDSSWFKCFNIDYNGTASLVQAIVQPKTTAVPMVLTVNDGLDYNTITLNGTATEGHGISIVGGKPGDASLYVNSGVSGTIYLRTGAPAGNTYDVRWTISGTNGDFLPGAPGAQHIGTASQPVAGGYTVTAFAVTSELTKKTNIRDLTSQELAAAKVAVKQAPKVYQLVDSVNEKGADRARWHVGAIYEWLQQTCMDNGVDPERLGIFCAAPVFQSETEEEGIPAAASPEPQLQDDGSPTYAKGLRYSGELQLFLVAGAGALIADLDAELATANTKIAAMAQDISDLKAAVAALTSAGTSATPTTQTTP